VIYICSQGYFIAPLGKSETPLALRRRISPFFPTQAAAERALAEKRRGAGQEAP
jgi:hypothetical protein